MAYKIRIFIITFLILFAVTPGVSYAQKGGGGGRGGGKGGRSSGKNMENRKSTTSRGSNSIISRDKYIQNYGIPEYYRNLINPLKATSSLIAEGKVFYKKSCEKCHGSSGKGDGKQVQYQFKQPSDFSKLPKKYWSNDAYLFWSIAEGGGQFEGAMPSFGQRESWQNRKSGLKNESIWKIILYIRTLLPSDNIGKPR